MEPSSTAFAPIDILLLRHMTNNRTSTDPPNKQLPTIIRVLYEIVDSEAVINSGTATPLASKIKKTPIVIIPPMKTAIANQIIGPAQHLTNKKKMIDNTTAAPAAATRTIQPAYKSYIQVPIESKLKLNIDWMFTCPN